MLAKSNQSPARERKKKMKEKVSGACKCANFKKFDIGTGNLLFVITKYGGVMEDEQYFETVEKILQMM